jgi:predicted HTH transcriptional regulator
MLSTEALEALAADLESFQVERKASFKPVKGAIEEAICAFANDLPATGAPGVVLIGVDDRTGAPTGSAVTDELLREVTDIRSGNPALAAGLKVLGFVQAFGVGINIARRACADNGNPSPEFAFGPSHLLATVRAAP